MSTPRPAHPGGPGPGRSRGRPPAFRARLARWILRLFGWSVRGPSPPLARYVLIGAPHTTNWDFFVGILALWALGIPGRWVGKHTLFRPPLGRLMRRLGGIPLDRERTSNFVAQTVEEFERREELVLLIAPEGTRSRTRRWKSGFYHIALGAGVPIVLGFADYPDREVGVGPALYLTGDVEDDMRRIAAFYADKRGKRPERAGPVRLYGANAGPGGDAPKNTPG